MFRKRAKRLRRMYGPKDEVKRVADTTLFQSMNFTPTVITPTKAD